MSRVIDIRPQEPLGLARTLALTLDGMRHRLARSVITLSVVAVAIAFLMHTLTESLIRRSLVAHAEARLEELRLDARWASRLTTPPSLRALLERDEGSVAARWIRFFDGLDYGRLRRLTGGRTGTEALDHLATDAHRMALRAHFEQTPALRPPTSIEEFDALLAAWPALRAELEELRARQAAAIRRLDEARGPRPVLEALAEADGVFGEQLRAVGFSLDAEEAAALARSARVTLAVARAEEALSRAEIRQAIAVRLDLLPREVAIEVLWPRLRHEEEARWFSGLPGLDLPPDLWREAARRRIDEERLGKIAALATALEGGVFGLGQRMTWLLLLSLVVCTVGIANAMLMAVTERYREIATFKCLGALDGSILLLFVIEASLLGLAGGIVGAFAGGLLGALGLLARHGSLALVTLPAGPLTLSLAGCALAGALLAACASLYPSLKAARLPPMEAMRIE
jgi:hypothetical protein